MFFISVVSCSFFSEAGSNCYLFQIHWHFFVLRLNLVFLFLHTHRLPYFFELDLLRTDFLLRLQAFDLIHFPCSLDQYPFLHQQLFPDLLGAVPLGHLHLFFILRIEDLQILAFSFLGLGFSHFQAASFHFSPASLQPQPSFLSI